MKWHLTSIFLEEQIMKESRFVDLTRIFVHMNVIGISQVPSKEERVLCRYFDMLIPNLRNCE